MFLLELVIIGLAFLIASSIVVYSVYLGITPTPTTSAVRKCMLESLPENLEGKIYELGSAFGGLALALARSQPKARVVAYELSPFPWFISRVRLFMSSVDNLEIRRANFLHTDLSDASAVVCYLFPGGMKALKRKLSSELPECAIVVSNTFSVPHWPPKSVHRVNDLYRTEVFVFQRPKAESSASEEHAQF